MILFTFLGLSLFHSPPKGAVLVIIDGAGESAWPESNSLKKARTPTLDYLKQNYPYASLVAAQQPVGLIRGEPGSSAVGHQTIGLGRTTPSYFQILEKSLRPNSPDSLFTNKLIRDTLRSVKRENSRIHFMGQCTDSGVFAHHKFLGPMFSAAKDENISKVFVHCFLMSMSRPASTYLIDVEKQAPEGDFDVVIGSIHSSETSLDKNRDWKKTAKSYHSLLNSSFANLSTRSHAEEFLSTFSSPSPKFQPLLLTEEAILRDNDAIVLFNFREDKSYQIAHALVNGLDGLVNDEDIILGDKTVANRPKRPKNLRVVPMVLYDKSLIEVPTILPAVEYKNGLGSWIAQKGFRQIRIAEQYKRPHVTIFFSGGILQPVFVGEERKVDFKSLSDSLADKNPEMNATLVTDTVVDAIHSNNFKLIVANYANVDATGHCGNETAVKLAIEFVDKKIKRIFDECEKSKYALFITSDHGNGEENTLINGEPQVDHTVNNVPFLTNLEGFRVKKHTYGKVPYIGNVASSILSVLEIEIPHEMEPSILEKDTEMINRANEALLKEKTRSISLKNVLFFLFGNMSMYLVLFVIQHPRFNPLVWILHKSWLEARGEPFFKKNAGNYLL